MSDDVMVLSGSARRLAEELDEDGIKLEEHDTVRELLLDELDYARRIPMFEGRRPLYGSFSMPPGMSISTAGGIADLVPLEGMPREMARTFADGRSAFVVNRHEEPPVLVCFDRPVQYEAELVHLQEVTGARIVQRTAVFGQVRLFADRRVIAWDGQSWTDRPTAAALLATLRQCAPDLDPAVAHGMLDLAVHWLSPARVGATIVVHEQDFQWAAMDVATKFHAPRLSIKNRQHFPALFASLQQHDLATLVTADGSVMYLGVGLRSSVEAERAVDSDRGMRHRSAQRFSYDHPSTTIAVVSDNGPVTIFRQGRAVGLAGGS
ncbi:MAG TPA: DNA integrity scanning protein DisA nucleotide-binding domain protein [Ilumatobacteraceae bacterium]|jgi:DisA bacterial checkpoint controller nucleotide-binding|nr:DNA integrity scanning protein DisA nucleotide-binding domain protein [Ilumatobacteraceae bacterium]